YDAARAALDEGLTYCRTHGVDLIELYLLADRARLEFEEGRWADAVEWAMLVLGRREVSTFPRSLALSLLARVRARRGDPNVLPLLEEARALAQPTGELWRLAPVGVAAAEAAWLRGDPAGARRTTQGALELALVAEGLRNAEIAQRLFLSSRTVGNHVSAILRKLQADTRGEAVAKAATLGLLPT